MQARSLGGGGAKPQGRIAGADSTVIPGLPDPARGRAVRSSEGFRIPGQAAALHRSPPPLRAAGFRRLRFGVRTGSGWRRGPRGCGRRTGDRLFGQRRKRASRRLPAAARVERFEAAFGHSPKPEARCGPTPRGRHRSTRTRELSPGGRADAGHSVQRPVKRSGHPRIPSPRLPRTTGQAHRNGTQGKRPIQGRRHHDRHPAHAIMNGPTPADSPLRTDRAPISLPHSEPTAAEPAPPSDMEGTVLSILPSRSAMGHTTDRSGPAAPGRAPEMRR